MSAPLGQLVTRVASFDHAPFPDVPRHAYLVDLTIPREVGSIVDHVPNTEHLRWLDRVAELHADDFGCTRAWLLERGIMWFVARHEIDYLAEIRPGDTLVAATWIREVDRVKAWREYAILRPVDETVVCRAVTLWVLVSLESRRPTRIPPEIRHRLGPLETTAPAPGPQGPPPTIPAAIPAAKPPAAPGDDCPCMSP